MENATLLVCCGKCKYYFLGLCCKGRDENGKAILLETWEVSPNNRPGPEAVCLGWEY